MTDLEAANKALLLLGVAPIGNLNDGTQPARVMSRLLEPAKRSVLSDFAWSFALRLQALTSSLSTPPAGYSHSYQYPAEAVNLYAVYSDNPNVKIPFLRAEQYIYTKTPAGGAIYTVAKTDLNMWSNGAVEALVTRLASDAAMTLQSDAQLSMVLLEKYRLLLMSAESGSVHEDYSHQIRPTHYIVAAEKGNFQAATALKSVKQFNPKSFFDIRRLLRAKHKKA
ncbi:MAG: hypothetical protein LBS45_00190, partial [Synergistaceae bacterium]|nr:hypothetical protein [Synergistaceae bacterium]